MITVCTGCGCDLDYPVDHRDADGADIWRSYCDRCNDRFEESMRVRFPHGQCGRCGAAYHPVTVECARCEGEGEVIVLDGDGYQWGACGACGGAGSTLELIALHEETLCGFPHGEGRWYERPTHVEILSWAREARDARRQAAVHAVARGEVDDIPF